jgi:hypothetical protein
VPLKEPTAGTLIKDPCDKCKGVGSKMIGEGITASFVQCFSCGGTGRTPDEPYTWERLQAAVNAACARITALEAERDEERDLRMATQADARIVEEQRNAAKVERDEARRALQAARAALLAARDNSPNPGDVYEICDGALNAMGTPGAAGPKLRECTCVGSCKGADGLADGWVCMMTKPATPAAPLCAPRCGSLAVPADTWDPVVFIGTVRDGTLMGQTAIFCTSACRDAGRPLHPTTPTPTKETPR